MHEFTDGCSSQYKSRNCMGDVSRIQGELGYSKIIRNCYETPQAKGPQDAAGEFRKHQTAMAILRGSEMIQNTKDCFDFADNKLRIPQSGMYKRRVFRYAEEIPRVQILDYKPVNQTIKNHQISSTGTTEKLHVRPLSCYECDGCLEGELENCGNKNLIGKHQIVEIKISESHNDRTEHQEDEQTDIDIRTLFTKNSVVAVYGDDPEYQFYIMKVTDEPHVMNRDVSDDWGCTFTRGSEILKSFYYDRMNNSSYKYKLIKRRKAIVHVVAVQFVCVELRACDEIKVPESLHLDILESLDEM